MVQTHTAGKEAAGTTSQCSRSRNAPCWAPASPQGSAQKELAKRLPALCLSWKHVVRLIITFSVLKQKQGGYFIDSHRADSYWLGVQPNSHMNMQISITEALPIPGYARVPDTGAETYRNIAQCAPYRQLFSSFPKGDESNSEKQAWS